MAQDAKPKCPSCGVQGIEHIVSKNSTKESRGGDAKFEVAFCDSCGHIYGVFPKVVSSSSRSLPAHSDS
jgi:uncharacterized Zn finger protein